jgi:3'-5' exoribonuclease
MARLPQIAFLEATSSGTGFFLCVRKERRSGAKGPFLATVLQDVSGEIGAKVFQDVDAVGEQFDVGEFVAVQGRGNLFHERLELILDKIRRVIPNDAALGFREEDCIRASPRPIDEMWQELLGRIQSVESRDLRELLERLVTTHEAKLRLWPAGVKVHHDYRSGLLEHILKIVEVSSFLADAYGARRDLLVAGAILHDIGKLEELSYALATEYTVEGNLVGHMAIGVGMLRAAASEIPGFPRELLLELTHLILSHHGSKELGSPVDPMTVEAFILAASDDLDAKLHQIRRHISDDGTDGPFTTYHPRLKRVLLKPVEPVGPVGPIGPSKPSGS